MIKSTFTVPSEDLNLTTNIPEAGLPEFLTRAIRIADEPSAQERMVTEYLKRAIAGKQIVRTSRGKYQKV